MRIIICITICFILSSCKKQISNKTSSPRGYHKLKIPLSEKGKLLVNKNWKEQNISIERNEKWENQMDITSQFMKSDLDDIMVFHNDGTYIFDEGNTKANERSKQIYQEGNWRIDEYDNKLYLSTSHSRTEYLIKAISASELILELKVTHRTKNYSYIITYSAIQ